MVAIEAIMHVGTDMQRYKRCFLEVYSKAGCHGEVVEDVL